MGCYPIFVEMTGRPCVVIGGGGVAPRGPAPPRPPGGAGEGGGGPPRGAGLRARRSGRVSVCLRRHRRPEGERGRGPGGGGSGGRGGAAGRGGAEVRAVDRPGAGAPADGAGKTGGSPPCEASR